jgi:hypothetical protein
LGAWIVSCSQIVVGPRRLGALGGDAPAAARVSIAQIVVNQGICDRITTIWAR